MLNDLFKKLTAVPRLLLEADLKPLQGDRFQPTGFADLGAARYQRPDGTEMLLVESAQSVANRLERAVIGTDGVGLRPELEGLPYVRVVLGGHGKGIETSSLVEAHRLNSPFIVANDKFIGGFLERAGYAKGRPIDWPRAAKAVFHFDPCSLLHGVFFANVEDGRLRFPRVVTGFVEAKDVREAASGGVKNNHFDPQGEIRAAGYDKDVYGNVPYSRLEFTGRIVAYFNVDLAQVRGYGLPEVAQQLVVALALYKIRLFLAEGLRLRTACDLTVDGDLRVSRPVGIQLPSVQDLAGALKELIATCRREKDLLAPEPLSLATATVRKEKKEKKDKGTTPSEPAGQQ